MTTNNDLCVRVSAFRCLELPGQPMMMHIGTSSLVGDLWNEVKALQEQLELARVKTYCASISEIAIERNSWKSLAENEQENVKKLTADRNHWKANHDAQVERARILHDRPDCPFERVRAYDMFSVMELERDVLREALINIQQVACSGSPELLIATEAITKSTGSPA